MKTKYWPYYLSRALLSLAIAGLTLGLTWQAAILGVILFGLFLLYLHSGWFEVHPETPLTPLRRDARGKEIQRKALIAALVCGTILVVIAPYLPTALPSAEMRYLALPAGIITYFGVQFFFLSRP